MHIIDDPQLRQLLDELHGLSDAQDADILAYFSNRSDIVLEKFDQDVHTFFADKLVALDRAKAEFCYALCRALNARHVIEVGTSHGVSTLYLAHAIQANGGGTVIGTEYEPQKANIAQSNFEQANLEAVIDLRVGDLRVTLQDIAGQIDFVLIDIWMEMAAPALKLIAPHLRRGAVVICDNTSAFRDAYNDYFDVLTDPALGFVTQTLPFEGGLEMSVKTTP